MKQSLPKDLILLSIITGLTACGGGGGGGGSSSSGGGSTPAPTGQAPTVSVEERIVVSAGQSVTLTATASDPDGDTISYSWQQQNDTAVNNRSGFDSAEASFSAPDYVTTLNFTVTASANGQSDQDSILVIVVEDTASAIFVDSDYAGTSDGSIDAPYTDLASILDETLNDNLDKDFYLNTPTSGSYSLWLDDLRSIFNNISLYGGYADDWSRDPINHQTPVVADGRIGLQFENGSEFIEISGLNLEVTQQDADANGSAAGLNISRSSAEFIVRHNTIIVADSPADSSAFLNAGVVAYEVNTFRLLNNKIEAGDAAASGNQSPRTSGVGSDGNDGEDGRVGLNITGGDGASGSTGWNGGRGGNAGNTSFEAGESGEKGAGRNTTPIAAGGCGGGGGAAGSNQDVIRTGGSGCEGENGARGPGGRGSSGYGTLNGFGFFEASQGTSGGVGYSGAGGGGGGGGGSGALGANGGAGGGGGEGGGGGAGGFGANSGGASMGVYLVGGDLNEVSDNEIIAGDGGNGGIGGRGASGGEGGDGGTGADGNDFGGNAFGGKGGNGGNGGKGGEGGQGGSGGGGPSFGIFLAANTPATIQNNQITTGEAGAGGSANYTDEAQAAGKGGWSVGIFDGDTSDSSSVIEQNNSFTLGQAGADGNPSEGEGTRQETNL